jgi:hypothetical protein
MTGRSIDEIQVAADPGAWRAAGFDMAGDVCEVGSVRLRLLGEGPSPGIVSWSVRGPGSPELDGLDTAASQREPASGAGHPNGVVAIDHVVILSPELDRTVAVLRAAGFDFRRLREGPTPGGSTRQAFFRLGEVIVEVVQAPAGTTVASDPHGPARLWGISFLVDNLDETAAVLRELLSEPRAAVQPGRSIATLGRAARLGPAVAFMTPRPGAI